MSKNLTNAGTISSLLVRKFIINTEGEAADFVRFNTVTVNGRTAVSHNQVLTYGDFVMVNNDGFAVE